MRDAIRPAGVVALRRALEWMSANGLEIVSLRPTWLRAIKRIAEATMLARYLIEHDLGALDPAFAATAREWFEATWLVMREGEFLAEAVERDATWIALASTYVPFHRRGMRNPRLEHALRARADHVDDSWFVRLATAVAYRQLAIPSPLDVDALAREAWCLRIPEYQLGDVGRIYETTHVVIWLTELDALPAEAATRLGEFTPRWIDHFRSAHNADLVAELVMTLHHLGRCADDDTWTWLLSRQSADGSLPEMDIPTRALGRFHVTVVTAMALAVCLGRRWCS